MLAVGCVERTISITSDPSGALVHLNDTEVGRTPLRVPFTHYGRYDVRVELDGHKPLNTTADADAPFWEYPGPDLVAEAIPGMESRIEWHFNLEPATPPGQVDAQAILDHAQQMRALLTEPAPGE